MYWCNRRHFLLPLLTLQSLAVRLIIFLKFIALTHRGYESFFLHDRYFSLCNAKFYKLIDLFYILYLVFANAIYLNRSDIIRV